jgi:hypothetical protein
MDYHLSLKQPMDKVFMAVPKHDDLIEMKPADDYTDVERGPYIYNGTVPKNTEFAAVTLLCYGDAGGVADFKLNESLSMAIGPGLVDAGLQDPSINNTLIVNSNPQIRYCLVEVPLALSELLSLPKYIHLQLMDVAKLRQLNNFSDKDLRDRGIDPERKTWATNVVITIPEWCTIDSKLDRPMLFKLRDIINKSPPLQIYCYSYTGIVRTAVNGDKS